MPRARSSGFTDDDRGVEYVGHREANSDLLAKLLGSPCHHPAMPCHPSAHRLSSLEQFLTQPFEYHGRNVDIAKQSTQIKKDPCARSMPRSYACVILQVGIWILVLLCKYHRKYMYLFCVNPFTFLNQLYLILLSKNILNMWLGLQTILADVWELGPEQVDIKEKNTFLLCLGTAFGTS